MSNFATLDKGYQSVRVAGKPRLRSPKASNLELPILGIFRETRQELARELAAFVHAVTRGKGYSLPRGQVVQVDRANGGDVGDIALLCSSPQEYNVADDPRLPKLLKDELAALTPKIPVFNPRGQDFSGLPQVRRLGGLLLCCLDRNADAEDVVAKGLGQAIRDEFQSWAQETEAWLKSGKAPEELVIFVDRWSNRSPGCEGYVWPKNTPAIDLVYALVHWLPEMYDDPEGQVYLEVFTRQLGAAEQVSGFKARVIYDPADLKLTLTSVGHLLLYFLGPIAAGTAKVDEDLIESFPRNRLNVLSIHQSKGLEFPLVIVDVGSDFPPTSKFPKGHYGHAFKRFPVRASTPHNLEDLMRPYSPLASLKRDPVDRAFDDLYRQFFVAFSRPQDVLLLVGLNSSKPGVGTIRNVATGWDRDEMNHWQPNPPFVDI